MQQLLATVTPEIPALLADLQAWCALESPSSDPAATTRMAEVIAAALRARGACAEVRPGRAYGGLVRAVWPGAADAAPILLLGHHDTVHPLGSLARNPPRVVDGRCYGPGSYDMKAGLLMVGAALGALQRRGRPLPRPVILLSTADEEMHSHDSRALIEETARTAAAVLVLEPAAASGALKTARKGVGMFTVVAYGRAAHAGVDHAAGVSAIAEMAHQVLALQALTDYGRGVTVNVGLIEGGTAINTVPARATAQVDLRVTTEAEAARVSRQILERRPVLPGARLGVTGLLERPPMERSAATARLFALARRLGAEIGLALEETSTGGASDGNFTAALGVPTLDGLGACGAGAHTDDEYVEIAGLAPRIALLAGMLLTVEPAPVA